MNNRCNVSQDTLNRSNEHSLPQSSHSSEGRIPIFLVQTTHFGLESWGLDQKDSKKAEVTVVLVQVKVARLSKAR
jgi:hypothetical protein